MKKTFYACLIAAISFCGLFSSCSDDEEYTVSSPFAGKTYDLVAFDSMAKPETSPITLKWDSKTTISLLGQQVTMNDLLSLASGIGFIEDANHKKLVMGEALGQVVNHIAFLKDGSVIAQYKDDILATEWKTAPSDIARHEIDNNGRIRLFLDVNAILNADSRATATDALPILLSHVKRMLTQGISITSKEVDGVTQFYLDKETVFNVLNDLVPLLKDKDFVAEIAGLVVSMLPEDENSLVLNPIIQGTVVELLTKLPTIMENTTDLHFGINTKLAE